MRAFLALGSNLGDRGEPPARRRRRDPRRRRRVERVRDRPRRRSGRPRRVPQHGRRSSTRSSAARELLDVVPAGRSRGRARARRALGAAHDRRRHRLDRRRHGRRARSAHPPSPACTSARSCSRRSRSSRPTSCRRHWRRRARRRRCRTCSATLEEVAADDVPRTLAHDDRGRAHGRGAASGDRRGAASSGRRSASCRRWVRCTRATSR